MKIKAKLKDETNYTTQTRMQIKQMQSILDKFATQEGFDEFCDANSIRLGVGKEDDIDLYFAPATWEAAEQFLMFCICHLIESEPLDEIPYYRELRDRYAAALGIEPGNFE